MGSAKPTLGYATRTEAAAALRAEGLSNAAIAIRLGISQNAVSGLLAPRQVERKPARRPPCDTTLAVTEGILLANKAGLIDHRSTEPAPTRLVEVHLSDAEFAALVQMARDDARTPAQTARACIRAGIALRGAGERGR